MKRVTLVLIIAALVGIGSFGASYFAGTNCCDVGKPGSEMEWLRKTYQLSEPQFTAIKALQESYQPECDRLCQRITEAGAKLDQVIQSNQSLTPEVEAALNESSAVREDCRKAMLVHIYKVAAEMSPASRDSYIKMMKSRIILPAMGHSQMESPMDSTAHSSHCSQ